MNRPADASVRLAGKDRQDEARRQREPQREFSLRDGFVMDPASQAEKLAKALRWSSSA